MTRLDRLEALAEKLKPRHELELEGLDFEVEELLDALPDLIQVARAASDALDMLENDQPGFALTVLRKDVKSSPLYREVES